MDADIAFLIGLWVGCLATCFGMWLLDNHEKAKRARKRAARTGDAP